MDVQDRIDDYLLGRMSAEEREIFEEEVAQDESIKEQLEFTRDVKNAISSKQSKVIAVKELQRQYAGEHGSSRWVLWLASGLVVAAISGLFVLNPQIFRREPSTAPDVVLRGDDGDIFERDTIAQDTTIITTRNRAKDEE